MTFDIFTLFLILIIFVWMIECNIEYKLLKIWKTLFAYFHKLISMY